MVLAFLLGRYLLHDAVAALLVHKVGGGARLQASSCLRLPVAAGSGSCL